MSLVAGFPGFGTHAIDLTALDQLIEQAAIRIQRKDHGCVNFLG